MPEPDYKIGQLIKHKLFNYRGVILKVDDSFKSTEEWYNHVAKSKPPKDKPWYTVLVHNACLLYTSPSPRDRTRSRMPSSA